ncbi:MAG TPA: MarR family transcriptional regulator [Bacteroidales bacterium]|nr:MarR family transcriptional regulator [Bacteroidales bacterium]
MDKLEKPLGMLIGKMMNEMFRIMRKRTGEQTEAKLTFDQFGLLYFINKEENEVIQKDVADVMCKDKSAILRMIDTLEEKELVRRVIDKDDRRKNRLMVTKKGKRTIEQSLQIEKELTNELLEGIDQSDLESFKRVINHIQEKAKQIL